VKTVLIADDSPDGREFLHEVLDRDGYRVVEAVNGRDAIQAACREHPDLIICDIQMPVADGYSVISELRGDPRFATTPVIALTAYAMQGDRARALAAGFTSYISKPVKISVLREEVTRLVPGNLSNGIRQ
jgi:two-component system cell cycle response regulator DivK